MKRIRIRNTGFKQLLLILVYILFQEENNFKYPLLQVGSGEKSLESGWPKIYVSDRIRILVPTLL